MSRWKGFEARNRLTELLSLYIINLDNLDCLRDGNMAAPGQSIMVVQNRNQSMDVDQADFERGLLPVSASNSLDNMSLD